MARVKAAHQVVKFICDIPANDDQPLADRVETVEEVEILATAPNMVRGLIQADTVEEIGRAIDQFNRLNTGSKSAVLWLGAPYLIPETGKYEMLYFLPPLTTEDEVKKPRRRFGFL